MATINKRILAENYPVWQVNPKQTFRLDLNNYGSSVY